MRRSGITLRCELSYGIVGNTLQRVLPISRSGDVTRLAWVGGLTTTIFVLDLFIPLGFAIWMLYLIPVWFTLRPHWQRLSLIHAALCSLFILAGFYGSPTGPVAMAPLTRLGSAPPSSGTLKSSNRSFALWSA